MRHVVHQIWLGNAKSPAEMQTTAAMVENAGWEYMLWDWNKLCSTLGEFCFGKIITSSPTPIIYRLIAKFYAWHVLSIDGGVYMDATSKLPINLGRDYSMYDIMYGGTMASPNSDFLYVNNLDAARLAAAEARSMMLVRMNTESGKRFEFVKAKPCNMLGSSFLINRMQVIWSGRGYVHAGAQSFVLRRGDKTEEELVNEELDLTPEKLQQETIHLENMIVASKLDTIVEGALWIPSDTKRLIIVGNSNVQLPEMEYTKDDTIVCFDMAVHARELVNAGAGAQILMLNTYAGRARNLPTNTEQFTHIEFFNPQVTMSKFEWMQKYSRRLPSTAFMLAASYKEKYPAVNITIIGSDFKHTRDRNYNLKEEYRVLRGLYRVKVVDCHYKIFYLITSCSKYSVKRMASRETWLKWMPKNCIYRFYLTDPGNGTYSEDTWNLENAGNDRLDTLCLKAYQAIVRAMEYDWDWLFLCDDDTFVVPNRLEAILNNNSENVDAIAAVEDVGWSRGPGIAIKRQAMEATLRRLNIMPDSGPKIEALLWDTFSSLHYVVKNTPEFKFSPDNGVPSKDNSIATVHWAAPAIMQDIFSNLIS